MYKCVDLADCNLNLLCTMYVRWAIGNCTKITYLVWLQNQCVTYLQCKHVLGSYPKGDLNFDKQHEIWFE